MHHARLRRRLCAGTRNRMLSLTQRDDRLTACNSAWYGCQILNRDLRLFDRTTLSGEGSFHDGPHRCAPSRYFFVQARGRLRQAASFQSPQATEIPQSLELRVQTGIAEETLALARIKWQQWSRLGIVPVNGVISPTTGLPSTTSFDPLYRDGWTVTGGIGRTFSERLSGLASITWDRGTSTISGFQTDS